MLYSAFIKNAKELTIQQLDNGTWYLEPDWRTILHDNGLDNLEDISDFHLDGWYDIQDVLVLEVERRNARDSHKDEVINWLYDLITTTVEPAMLKEETDFVQNVVDFMRANHQIENNTPNEAS